MGLSSTIAAGPRQRSHSQVRVPLSQIRDSPNMEGQVLIFITPRNRVARLYPQALGSLFVASYVLYEVRILSKESRRLVLPRTSCIIVINIPVNVSMSVAVALGDSRPAVCFPLVCTLLLRRSLFAISVSFSFTWFSTILPSLSHIHLFCFWRIRFLAI
jgi:hypothetical protein